MPRKQELRARSTRPIDEASFERALSGAPVRVELAPGVLDDFERIVAHLERFGVEDGSSRIAAIVAAFDALARSPLIGRPAKEGLRALVIGRGAAGSVALYRFVPAIQTVFILAVRGQREGGYRG